MDFMEGAK